MFPNPPKQTPLPTRCDVLVIGTGMAGQAAALFSARQGLTTILAGTTSTLRLSSGLLDLLAVHPMATQRCWQDPWAALRQLRHDLPQHPYARIQEADLRSAWQIFLDFLQQQGLPYQTNERNVAMLTPAGTIKMTFALPSSMWPAVQAWQKRAPVLLVDFHCLKGFSAHQIRACLQKYWPALQARTITFPVNIREVYPEQLARLLEQPAWQEELVAAIRPYQKNVTAVGLPAVLGLTSSTQIYQTLVQKLELPIFEIPTLPPSVPGLRLQQIFAQGLAHCGVHTLAHHEVLRLQPEGAGFCCHLQGELTIQADSVILATGRFLGKGLISKRQGLQERLLHLPVYQPASRQQWHATDFFTPAGHLINQAGLEVDDYWRPLNQQGRPAFERLLAVGSILAHQDWMRMKSGAGLAIATAYAATEALTRL